MVTGEQDAATFLRIMRGDPTAEEIAALVAVLSIASLPSSSLAARPQRVWSSPSRSVRTPLSPGHGGWRASARTR